MNAPLIGARIQRKEDYRFLTGTGVYTDDAALPNQTYAAFVRSPHAHAKIKTINADAAKRHKGVLAVYTGEDLATAKVGGLPCGWLITDVNGKPMKEPPYPPLAQGKVRHVGERVAVVIAEALEQARDAAESIEVDYDVLPAVVEGVQGALRAGNPRYRAGQHLLRLGAGGQERRRRCFCQGGACHQARVREQPPRAERDRAARRERDLFARRGQLHAVRGESEPARRAPAHDGVRARAAGDQGARRCAGRGRRLRLENLPLRRRRGRPGRRRSSIAR